MKKKITLAVRAGRNVSDILHLPCVKSVHKCNDGNGAEWLEYHMTDSDIVEEGDYIVQYDDNSWGSMSYEKYKSLQP